MQTFIPVYKSVSTKIGPEAVVYRPDFIEELQRAQRKTNRELLICLENPHITPVLYTALWERKEEHDLTNQELAAFGLWLYNYIFDGLINKLTNPSNESISKQELIETLETEFKKAVGIKEIKILSREEVIAKEAEAIENEEGEEDEAKTIEDFFATDGGLDDDEEESISLIDAHDEEGLMICSFVYDEDKYNPKLETVMIDICETIHRIYTEMFYSTQKDHHPFLQAMRAEELQDMSVQQYYIRRKLYDTFITDTEYYQSHLTKIHHNIFHDKKSEILYDSLRANIVLIEDLVHHEKITNKTEEGEVYLNLQNYIDNIGDNEKSKIEYYINEYITNEIVDKVALEKLTIDENTHDKHKHYLQEAKDKMGVE